ncbi:MAG: hypothetical protein M1814_002744 [Vezdaea aestivalis]|nr:MAG: hypothetical protein M1814_002744 [Vezdaea aestivalis]
MSAPAPGSFAPKQQVKLNPPRDDPISTEVLKTFDGTNPSSPTYVAIKGEPIMACDVFAGKDASRALALSSLKPEDAVPAWSDLDAKAQKTLDDWFSFFSQRYNIVGTVAGASNL